MLVKFMKYQQYHLFSSGIVYEWTQDYAMSMEFAALMFFMSSVVQSLVPIIDKFSANKDVRVIEVKEMSESETSSELSSANVRT